MPTINDQSYLPDYSKELDIESIISAPLVAVSKANTVMVTGQTRFLLEYCFTKTDDEHYKPVMVTMMMNKGVIDYDKDPDDPAYIKQVQLTFSIPLLCIIPINSLAVEKVAIDFDMEITSTVVRPNNSANETPNKVIDNKAQLNGKISYDPAQADANTQYKSHTRNTIKVSLNAGTLPLPTGVLTILDLYTKAIQPVAINNSDPNKPIK